MDDRIDTGNGLWHWVDRHECDRERKTGGRRRVSEGDTG